MSMRRAADELDRRFPLAAGLRSAVNKVFPTHFSFLFGEIALYSLVVLILSGVYLALFFDPSMVKVHYDGVFTNLEHVEMSRAYASTLDISFEVRGGLLVRQIHHWASLVFAGAILIHMLRVFFTGAFRKPRETNWAIGITLFTLALVEGFIGYSLPDDLLSGTGVRIMSGIVLSIPVAGTWLHWLIFGSEFPGEMIISRFFTLHVFVVPGLIVGLVAVHLALVWYQKHTQFPGRRGRESNVVGTRTVPIFALKSASLLSMVTGFLVLMGGLFQINPIFNYGPYDPAHVSINSQPDWYMLFTEGAIRLFPPADIQLFGEYIVPTVFWPAVVMPAVLFVGLTLYPLVERRLSRDREHHNLLQRPRDVPERTGLGALALTFYAILVLAGCDDLIAHVFEIPIEPLIEVLRFGILLLPPLAFLITRRLCLRLQRVDAEVLHGGVRTGLIEQDQAGYYVEIRQPVHALDEAGSAGPAPYVGARLPTLPGDLDTTSRRQH